MGTYRHPLVDLLEAAALSTPVGVGAVMNDTPMRRLSELVPLPRRGIVY